jgi:hypothetical protein
MTRSKQISQSNWPDFCVTFSNGNKGRTVAIEVFGEEEGDLVVVDSAPLLGIAYDPLGKGNDLIVETGRDEVEYAHRIAAPTEVWEAQAEDGLVTALEIVDQNGTKTVIAFAS